MYARIRAATLCRAGWHCRAGQRIQKYDGGRLPQLCRHCRLITGYGRRGC